MPTFSYNVPLLLKEIDDKKNELKNILNSCSMYSSKSREGADYLKHESHSDSHDYCHACIEWLNWLNRITDEGGN